MSASTQTAAQSRPGTGAGSQTLMRGLDVLEALAQETLGHIELAERLGLTKSTAHRLASALVDRGYLAFRPREGYRLGPKLLELGFLAQAQADLVQIARPHLDELSRTTGDTVHLGILDGDEVMYLDKIAGQRRITISSRVGDRQPLSSTGLGKALMLDRPESYWLDRFDREERPVAKPDRDSWIEHMRDYATAGCALDLEENEDQIRCVATAIRDASGAIVGAISVSSAAQYMSDERMTALRDHVRGTGSAISHELGWTPEAGSRPARRSR